jgi:hypothetical protein
VHILARAAREENTVAVSAQASPLQSTPL